MSNRIIEFAGIKAVKKYEINRGRPIDNTIVGRRKGFDLASREPNGNVRFIEVKTTAKSFFTFRWLEPRVYEKMEIENNFWLYLVVDALTNPKVKTLSKRDLLSQKPKKEVKVQYSFSREEFNNLESP